MQPDGTKKRQKWMKKEEIKWKKQNHKTLLLKSNCPYLLLSLLAFVSITSTGLVSWGHSDTRKKFKREVADEEEASSIYKNFGMV